MKILWLYGAFCTNEVWNPVKDFFVKEEHTFLSYPNEVYHEQVVLKK